MPITLTLVRSPERAGTLVPGSSVQLQLAWSFEAPAGIDVSLVYRTAGKGTQDAVSVATETIQTTAIQGQSTITLTLPPEAPPSYDGKLLSVSWFAEARAGKKESAELPLVVSSIGRPITPARMEK